MFVEISDFCLISAVPICRLQIQLEMMVLSQRTKILRPNHAPQLSLLLLLQFQPLPLWPSNSYMKAQWPRFVVFYSGLALKDIFSPFVTMTTRFREASVVFTHKVVIGFFINCELVLRLCPSSEDCMLFSAFENPVFCR